MGTAGKAAENRGCIIILWVKQACLVYITLLADKKGKGVDMQLEEVIRRLEALSPPSFAESWDNSGLMCGRKNKEIEKIE